MSPSKVDIEHSELLLYQNMVLRESGQLNEALKYIEEYDQLICDKLSLKEIKGMLVCVFTIKMVYDSDEILRW